MSEAAVEALVRIIVLIVEALGPEIVRQRIDEWEAARKVSEAAFAAKFGENP